MATSRSWRRTLLGSLQGQLQLATYLAVFIGFTAASSAGLWIGQRNLIQNDLRELRDSADSIQQCLRKGGGDDASVRQELLLHSGMRTSLWIEQPTSHGWKVITTGSRSCLSGISGTRKTS